MVGAIMAAFIVTVEPRFDGVALGRLSAPDHQCAAAKSQIAVRVGSATGVVPGDEPVRARHRRLILGCSVKDPFQRFPVPGQ